MSCGMPDEECAAISEASDQTDWCCSGCRHTPSSRFDGMSPAQRLAYEADPMVQHDPLWKALGSEDVAEALHTVHAAWSRTAVGGNWRECWTCCTNAIIACRTLAARSSS